MLKKELQGIGFILFSLFCLEIVKIDPWIPGISFSDTLMLIVAFISAFYGIIIIIIEMKKNN